MRCACVDIGSNTTRLLVAEPDGDGLREVLAQRVFTRLGGGAEPIPAAKIASVAETVAAQARLAREAGAVHVCVVGTAAVRHAANGASLCAAVREASGLGVSVLSGEDEARLAFLGATRTADAVPGGVVAVVDVGGGSTELVCGTVAGGVTWAWSFAIGSASLTDRCVRSDPPGAAELDEVRACVAETFAGVAPPRAATGYAVGGSATSLRRLVGEVLDAEALGRAVAALCTAPARESAERFDLHIERVRVLPAGMLVLDAAVALLGLPLRIAGGGLREGVLVERFAAAQA